MVVYSEILTTLILLLSSLIFHRSVLLYNSNPSSFHSVPTKRFPFLYLLKVVSKVLGQMTVVSSSFSFDGWQIRTSSTDRPRFLQKFSLLYYKLISKFKQMQNYHISSFFGVPFISASKPEISTVRFK